MCVCVSFCSGQQLVPGFRTEFFYLESRAPPPFCRRGVFLFLFFIIIMRLSFPFDLSLSFHRAPLRFHSRTISERLVGSTPFDYQIEEGKQCRRKIENNPGAAILWAAVCLFFLSCFFFFRCCRPFFCPYQKKRNEIVFFLFFSPHFQ